MSWGRVDDGIVDHPKFRGLNDAGWSLWVRALAWSAKHRTEGHLPSAEVKRMGSTATVRELLRRKIWERRPDGSCQIHDFLKYNCDKDGNPPPAPAGRPRKAPDTPPSPELSAARARAGKLGGQSLWAKRRATAEEPPDPPAPGPTDDKPDGKSADPISKTDSNEPLDLPSNVAPFATPGSPDPRLPEKTKSKPDVAGMTNSGQFFGNLLTALGGPKGPVR